MQNKEIYFRFLRSFLGEPPFCKAHDVFLTRTLKLQMKGFWEYFNCVVFVHGTMYIAEYLYYIDILYRGLAFLV